MLFAKQQHSEVSRLLSSELWGLSIILLRGWQARTWPHARRFRSGRVEWGKLVNLEVKVCALNMTAKKQNKMMWGYIWNDCLGWERNKTTMEVDNKKGDGSEVMLWTKNRLSRRRRKSWVSEKIFRVWKFLGESLQNIRKLAMYHLLNQRKVTDEGVFIEGTVELVVKNYKWDLKRWLPNIWLCSPGGIEVVEIEISRVKSFRLYVFSL